MTKLAKEPRLISKRNSMKTNKSYKKRIKVTKNGKIIARVPGQCHFNSRANGSKRVAKRRPQELTSLSNRTTRRFLAGI